MYLLAPFIWQNFKKCLEPIQRYKDVPFSGPKWPICPEQHFLVQTIIITFIYLLALFIVQNFKKFFELIQSYQDVPFLAKNGPFAPNEFFFEKLLISFSFTYQPLSLCKIYKKNLPGDPELSECAILGPKVAHLPKLEFIQKTC